MAADGSRWQLLERAPSRLAPRDAIGGDFLGIAEVAQFDFPQSVDRPLPGVVKIGRLAELSDPTIGLPDQFSQSCRSNQLLKCLYDAIYYVPARGLLPT
jgi:hypothetical protein